MSVCERDRRRINSDNSIEMRNILLRKREIKRDLERMTGRKRGET